MIEKKLPYLIIYLIFSILVLLTGCKKDEVTNRGFVYKGESKSWTASYKMKGKMQFVEGKDGRLGYEEDGEGKFTLTYKGDMSELSNVKHLKYSFEGIGNKSETNLEFDKPLDRKNFSDAFPKISMIYAYTKDSIMKVTVTWDGNSGDMEIIELKN